MNRRSFLGLLAFMLPAMRAGWSKAAVPSPISGTFAASSFELESGRRELSSYCFCWLPPDGHWVFSTEAPVEMPPAAIVPLDIWRKFNSGDRIPDGPGRWRVET